MKKSKKGFTLIELLVCIAIIALLLIAVVPSLLGARDRARRVVFENQVKELRAAATMFTLDYPNTLTSWSAPAGTKGNKNTIITNANMMDSWNLYLDEFPSDPTRPPGSTFLVEIFDNGEINITPDMPGGEFYNNN